jgi:hypothetical protein
MKQNKTAIFIRGHKRTWDWIKQSTFKTFEQAYGTDIDWYVAAWKSNTTDYESLSKDFDGKNLKSFYIIDENDYPMPMTIRGHGESDVFNKWIYKLDCYWRLAYLDQILSRDKIKNEFDSCIRYDTVLFTRFDLYHILDDDNNNEKYVKPKPFTISAETTRDEDFDFAVFDDWQYKTDSLTSDIVSFRFFDTHINDYYNQATPLSPEVLLSNYLFRNGIVYNRNTTKLNLTSFIIRPDQCGTVVLPTRYYSGCLPNPPWLSELREYQLSHCNRTNIDPKEYNIFS